MIKSRNIASALIATTLAAATIVAGGCSPVSLRSRGYVAADTRYYPVEAKYAGQYEGVAISGVLEPELSAQTEDTDHTFTLKPFLRFDPQDAQRTHFDLRQADYVLSLGEWELSTGASVFTWGVLEAYRPTDVLNTIDFVEDPNRTQKLGSPYARIAYSDSTFSFQFLYLPVTRPQTFPGIGGRIRPAGIVDANEPMFESTLGYAHPNLGMRIGLHVDEVDLALTGFSGLSREPTLIPELRNGHVGTRYDFLQQGGLDLQWTHDSFVFKAEGAFRAYGANLAISYAIGTGLEYTFSDVLGSGADLTFVLEHYWDQRPIDSPFTLFDNDAFGGFRLALNNSDDTEIRAGALVDIASGTTFATALVRHRLLEHWTVVLEGRTYLVTKPSIMSSFENDHFVQLRVAYYL